MSIEKKPVRQPVASPGVQPSALTRWLPTALGVLLVLVAAAGVGFTQSPDDIKTVLKELEAIKKELAELKTLVQQRPVAQAPSRSPAVGSNVAVVGAAVKGKADAPVTIVEFSDYQCPFCARHVTQTIPELDKEYIQTGKVKYVYRNLPIESIHPNAFKAAEAAECANDQNKFWPMHDRLFGNQQMLGPAQLPAHATAAGLEASAFQQCLASGKYATKIRKDMTDAGAVGITGTPGFLVGKTVPGSPTIKVEAFLSGAKPFAAFKAEIDKLLGQ